MNLSIECDSAASIQLSQMNKQAKDARIIEHFNSNYEYNEDAIFVINPSEVRYRYQLIQSLLPTCKHYFAVKSCPQKAVIDEIKKLNGYFDVASSGELNLLKKSNVETSNCIHTHPIKKISEIRDAFSSGIETFVIDNEFELEKFSSLKHKVQFMLRLSFSNSEAKINLSSKFGLNPNEALSFIIKARMNGYKIKGLCFHVGSQMPTNHQYIKALETCKELFDEASQIGIILNTIDIGGGFPFHVTQNMDELEAFFNPINQYLESHFAGVDCWAEPGRFVSSSIALLVCRLVGKAVRDGRTHYYLNDGVYGCLSNKIFDFYDMSQLKIFDKNGLKQSDKQIATLFGPTCDSIDQLSDDVSIPKAEIGDYFLFENMGAYSIASTTNFNMLGYAKVVILDF